MDQSVKLTISEKKSFSHSINHLATQSANHSVAPLFSIITIKHKWTFIVEISETMMAHVLFGSSGDPKLTGTASLDVTVSDVNDNFPVFKEDYRPVVYENRRDGENGITFPLQVQIMASFFCLWACPSAKMLSLHHHHHILLAAIATLYFFIQPLIYFFPHSLLLFIHSTPVL